MRVKLTLFVLSVLFLIYAVSSAGPLKLHEGPVMNFPISIHYLWYGPFGVNDEEVQILYFVGKNIHGTAWWKITTCLEDNQGNPVTSVLDVPETPDQQSYIRSFNGRPTSFTGQSDIVPVMQELIQQNGLLLDPNDIYVLFLHDDVQAQFLCSDTCSCHGYFNNSGNTPIKYIVVGMEGLDQVCSPGCTPPNGPWLGTTNQLTNSFVHQLIQTVSNPVPWTGWYDADGQQNGQKCAGNYMNAQPFRPNTSQEWNIAIVGAEPHWFLIQANWDIESNACQMIPTQDCSVIAPSKPVNSAPHKPNSASPINVNMFTFSVVISSVFALFLLF